MPGRIPTEPLVTFISSNFDGIAVKQADLHPLTGVSEDGATFGTQLFLRAAFGSGRI
jgi:hypothetical protein